MLSRNDLSTTQVYLFYSCNFERNGSESKSQELHKTVRANQNEGIK